MVSPSSSSSPWKQQENPNQGLSISDEELDENGFPALSLSEADSDSNGAHQTFDNGDESFAAEFYRSGSDWSCLLEHKLERTHSDRVSETRCLEKNLVQADLFKVWGFKKPVESKPEVSNKRAISDDRNWVDRKVRRLGEENDNRRRVCPFYKKIPGTPFTVDAFRYGQIEGCTAYFLTHFHADHYGGLSKKWSHGPIYCTPLTARLLKMCLAINPLYICPLELDIEHVIEGITVTMLEANHCPGAALLHFRLTDGRCYLHTGDFRASKKMQSHSLLVSQRVNVLYLDTTYCNPKYSFPSKEDVISFVVRITKNRLEKQPKTLIVVGAYSIGKEQVYLAISEALGVQIYTDARRRRILQSFGWPELSERLCSCGQSTTLHVLPISSLRPESLKQYLEIYQKQFDSVLAFRPTGWTYSEKIGNQLDLIKPSSKGNVTIYGVPYSEHSSFLELREFVQFLKPGKIIPTVNVGNASYRDKMQSYFKDWLKG